MRLELTGHFGFIKPFQFQTPRYFALQGIGQCTKTSGWASENAGLCLYSTCRKLSASQLARVHRGSVESVLSSNKSCIKGSSGVWSGSASKM